MAQRPVSAVWELTMACNLRCLHCGSACAGPLPGELSTDEAVALCDDLIAIGLGHITLSGGEPLLRQDWDVITRHLSRGGLTVAMISNGSLVTDEIIDRASASGLSLIGLSLDGLEATHDFIRGRGSFQRILNAVSVARARDYPVGVVTTLVKRNLPELPLLRELLVSHGVRQWQLQLGTPMGRLSNHREELLEPSDVPGLLEFARRTHRERVLRVDLADCLGYFTAADQEVRQSRNKSLCWGGCQAGRLSFGILHNGDICGCNAIREPGNVEGNIRTTRLHDIWTRPGAFAWNRARTRQDLSAFCRLCRFGHVCLAGCTSARRTLGGSDGDYSHCAYRLAVEGLFSKVDRMTDPTALAERAEKAQALGLEEVADRCRSRARRLAPCDSTPSRPGLVTFDPRPVP